MRERDFFFRRKIFSATDDSVVGLNYRFIQQARPAKGTTVPNDNGASCTVQYF